MNRRNFIQATLAALATRKWPAVNWPEPVEGAAKFSDMGGNRNQLGRIIYVDGARGKDDGPEDGLTPRTAYRHMGNTWLIEVAE